jgi:hypothetical protein
MDAARKNVGPLEDQWLSQPQAAAELNCSRHMILGYIARGELTAAVVAGRTVVSRESVARLKEARAAEAATV